jgi:excisionase family DNA binding protein
VNRSEAELPQVLTLTEAARFVRVSEKTLGEMARRNRIPCQKAGREWRFLKPALEQWLEGNKGESFLPLRSETEPGDREPRPWKQGEFFKEKGFGDTAFIQNRAEPLHRWVPWIAGFSSSFVEEVFDSLIPSSSKQARICDPFAGVGTTLVEGFRRGYQVIGFEINPYAALACRVKLSSFQYDLPFLKGRIQKFAQFMARAQSSRKVPKSMPPAGFKSRDPFFSRFGFHIRSSRNLDSGCFPACPWRGHGELFQLFL